MAKRTKSALKANRQNVTRREHNRQMRSKLRTALRAIRASLDAKDVPAAKAALAAAPGKGLPPVDLWNPPFCGDIGMRIARDGTWFYRGSPIGRPALVKLFSTILRRDPDRHVLVTPVEMVSVEVEDAPFVAVELEIAGDARGPLLRFRTNVGDEVEADAAHPLAFEPGPSGGLKPYVEVRHGLRALVKRSLFYDLVERGETRDIDGRSMYGVSSGGEFFPMVPADEIEGLT